MSAFWCTNSGPNSCQRPESPDSLSYPDGELLPLVFTAPCEVLWEYWPFGGGRAIGQRDRHGGKWPWLMWHRTPAKCAILSPDLGKLTIKYFFISKFRRSGHKIAHLATSRWHGSEKHAKEGLNGLNTSTSQPQRLTHALNFDISHGYIKCII